MTRQETSSPSHTRRGVHGTAQRHLSRPSRFAATGSGGSLAQCYPPLPPLDVLSGNREWREPAFRPLYSFGAALPARRDGAVRGSRAMRERASAPSALAVVAEVAAAWRGGSLVAALAYLGSGPRRVARQRLRQQRLWLCSVGILLPGGGHTEAASFRRWRYVA